MKLTIALLISVLLMISVVNAAPVTFSQTSCSGNQICTTTLSCDIAGGCKPTDTSCKVCPDITQFCPDGSVAKCSVGCESQEGVSTCGSCTPQCPEAPPNTLVLPFKVYVKKFISVTINPQQQSALAGTAVDYNIQIKNDNPITVTLLPQIQIPDGWSTSELSQITLSPNQSSTNVTVTITSNQSAEAGLRSILLALFSPQIGSSVYSFRYQVSTHAEPTISITPQTRNVIADGTASYNIMIANNDGPQYDPATAFVSVVVPEGWQVDQPQSPQLKPGESTNLTITVTVNSTPKSGSNAIKANVSMFSLTAEAEANAVVSACGDGICQNSEVCAQDCPEEANFKCNGRCEQQTDFGLRFSTVVQNFLSTKFFVCNKASTPEECESVFDSGSCGEGQNCLCGNSVTGTTCSLRCVDVNGAYYMAVRGVTGGIVKSANYEYSCPYVNLPELVSTRDNLTLAKEQFEKSRSILQESIANAQSQDKNKFIPCFDGLGLIIQNTNAHLIYMNDVIAHPAVSNTTDARQKTDQLRNLISSTFNKYCRAGVSGALRISNLDIPASVEKDDQIQATVSVQNSGSINYYGYSQCEFKSPSNSIKNVNGTCKLISVNSVVSDRISSLVDTEGDWKVKCRVIGSLKSDCSSEVHDETQESTFNVYSRETFVSSVQGSCDSQVICSVTTSRATADVGCRIGSINCAFRNASGSTTNFACPRPSNIGNVNITGFVSSGTNTVPVDPTEKTSSVRCGGIGDGIVEGSEQCEPPNTVNNSFCAQQTFTCDGKRFGTRPANGYCAPNDQCIPSSYSFSCNKNSCNAQCSDGETRNFTITNNEGRSCSCVQQCGATCEYNSCLCEIPPKEITFLSPTTESIIRGQALAAVYANNESSIFLGLNTLSPTCLGEYPLRTTRTLESRFETTINTTLYLDGRYYLCAKSSTNLTSISIVIRNNEAINGTNRFISFITPSDNTQINGSVLVAVNALNSNSTSLGVSQLSSTCLGQYNIQTVRTTNDRFETTLNTTSYPDGVYYLCAKSGDNLTSINIVIKNAGAPAANLSACAITIADKSCVYNTISNRYNVVGTASWTGGDHSHLIIENDEGLQQRSALYRRTLEVTGEGSKSLRAVVHNAEHIILCYNQTTIMCTKDSSNTGDVGVNVKRVTTDEAQKGDLSMEFVITSTADTQLELTERLPNGLIIKELNIYNNDTPISYSQASVSYDGSNYNAYTFTIGLTKNKIIRLNYKTSINTDGVYKFVSTSRYGSQSLQESKSITVSSCEDTTLSYFINSAGECRQLRACDAVFGWDYVEACPSARTQETQGDNTLLIVAVVIIVIAIAAYTQRDKIAQWMEERQLAKKYES